MYSTCTMYKCSVLASSIKEILLVCSTLASQFILNFHLTK